MDNRCQVEVAVIDSSNQNVGDSEDDEDNFSSVRLHAYKSSYHESLKAIAGVAGNVLEWYDFAVFGFFSDVLGKVFFPKDQPGDLGVIESFAVFGCAFLMRPIGGLIFGYIGDVHGRKKALELSIFLMAFATTAMGCLPTYNQVGGCAVFLLVLIRMVQGMSVGGQLMSSLVFTLEGRPQSHWVLIGSFVLVGANLGTFLGGLVAYALHRRLTNEQLVRWGWRLPFLSGILVSLCGIYLKYFCDEDEIHPQGVGPGHAAVPTDERLENLQDDAPFDEEPHIQDPPKNPLRLAFSSENRRSLIACAIVPLLWSGGFYLSFVWMAIYMADLIDPPVPAAFGVNSISLLLIDIWFPVAGWLSDRLGRRFVMTIGCVGVGCMGPLLTIAIGQSKGRRWIAFIAQNILGFELALFGAPMCAWLVEAFEPAARLTSVAIGYNVAQAIGGGTSPFLASLLVDVVGKYSPGIMFAVLGLLSFSGLWFVAPGKIHATADTAIQLKCNDENVIEMLEEVPSLGEKEIS